MTPEAIQGARVAAGRAAWPPLPRRARPKWTPSLLAIRTPISRVSTWTLTILSVVVPLAAWIWLSATGEVDSDFLPSPAAVWEAGVGLARSGELITDLWASVYRVLLGFGLAVLVSVPLGIFMGTFRAWQAAFEPMIGLLRYLPAAAFIPLLIIWLGLGEEPKIAILFIGTVFFNTLMTADVVRNVPAVLINVSYTLGARRGEVLRKVIVPHSLPGIIDAIRINAAAAWGLVIVAELIASTEGLGKRISLAQRFLQTDKIFAVLVVIGIVGLTIDLALRLLRDRVGRWAA